MDRLTGCFAAKTTRYTTLVVMSLLFCSRLVFAQSDSIKNQIKADTIALKKLERLNDQAGIVNSCLHIALSYYQLGEFNAHVQYAQRAFDLSKKIGDKKLMAVALVRLGSGYIYISDYPRALNCFLQQLKLLENTGDKLNTAKAQGNIGLIYYYLKNYPEALAYSNKCLHALQQLNDKVWVAASLNNIGGIYLEMGDYANAIVYNMKAIQINTQIRSAKGIGNDLMDIGVAYYKQHDFIKAYQYMRRSEAIYDSLGAKNNMAITLGHLALIYTYAPDSALVVMAIKPSQRFAKAVQLQQQAIALAGITKSRITEADQWKNLTLIYERQQNYKAAFKSLNKYNALKDSIFNDKKRNELSRLYIAYEFDKKAAELRAENAEK
ncbi:MAG: tetratricopeptide repeat protein, partial [Mucilaginibacter sp.]